MAGLAKDGLNTIEFVIVRLEIVNTAFGKSTFQVQITRLTLWSNHLIINKTEIMKAINLLFSALMLTAMIGMTACGSESDTASEDEAREALAAAPNADKPAANTASTTASTNAVPTPTGPTTTMSFGETTFDFGTVDEGEKVSHVYEFTNTGSEPLVISNAKGSCGCTVPKWPKNPIAPGETGEILVEFNSKGKTGKQTKRVTITANTDPAQSFLTITGQVNKAAAEG